MTKIVFRTCLLLALIPLGLHAQTAHAGATIEVSSGYSYPSGVAVDGYGNVFVADYGSGQVKEIVAVNGVVSTSSAVNIIGSNFQRPEGVAVDGYGNVFVADYYSGQVKEIVAVNGVVSTSSTVNIIGSNFQSPEGVAVDGYGNVFVANYGSGQVKEIVAVNGVVSASSTVNVIGSNFNYPKGVAVDGYGNVFVANYGSGQVKEIVAMNGAVSASSTVNAIGSGFTYPQGVAVDRYGNVFVAQIGGLNSALEIVAVNGVVSATSTVERVGTGYSIPAGVAVDSSGNVFVADAGNNDVLEVLSGTQKFPTTAVGSTSAPLTVYFTFDTAGSLAANPYVVLTQGAKNLDFQAAATQPSNACVTGQGYNPGDTCAVNVTFAPTSPGQRIGAVQLMGASGTPIATFTLHGTGTGPQVTFPGNQAATTLASGFNSPSGLAVDGSGNVFFADEHNNNVKEILAGTSSAVTLPTGSGFSYPAGVAVDGSGNVFVADLFNSSVKEIMAVNGAVPSNASVFNVGNFGFRYPAAVAVDGSGNVFVADYGLPNAVYQIMAVNGVISASSPVNAVGSGFNRPAGIAVDGNGNVFVADSSNHAVYEIAAVNGVATGSSTVSQVGNFAFSSPIGVAVDGIGNVFVVDSGTNSVYQIVAVNGLVSANSTVIAVGSSIKYPNGVALDASGNLYVADNNNNAIREINRATPPSLTFDTTVPYFTSSDSPQSIRFQNSGNVPLTTVPPGLVLSGSSFALVPGSGTPADCTGTFSLASGQECNLSLSFIPTGIGPLTGTVTLTDNSVRQTIQLSGTGQQATQNITFNNPGVQVVGIPLTLGATATSGLAVTYSSSTQTVCTVSGTTATLLAPGPCSITAAQQGNASYAAAMSVTQTFTVSATPIAPSAPNNGAFPSTNVGVTSTAATVTFTFDESETLASTPYVVLTQGAQNLDFQAAATQPANVCTGAQTYNPGDTCTVNITFTPTKPYQRIGAVQLMGSGGTPIATFDIHGVGVGPQLIFPSNSTLSTLNSTFNNPEGVAVDGSGNVFVSDEGNHAIEKIMAGTSQAITLVGGLYGVRSLAVDGSGNVFFADEGNSAVQEIVAVNGVVSANSQVITVASGFYSPRGVAVDGGGNVFVAAFSSAVYEVVATNGVVSNSSNIIQLATNFNFNRAQSVAVDAGGNVFVADTYSNAIVEIVAVNGAVSATSQVITLASNFSLSYPAGVAVDGSGNVYVADTGHNAVVEIVAVNGAVSSSSSAVLLGSGYNSPFALAVDASGNLFVVNQNSNSLTELDRSDPPSLTFANTNVNSTSSAQSVTIENIGNARLLESALTVGTNFTQVPASGIPADCTASTALLQGASCNLSISFKPTASGPLSAFAVLTSNTPASPQSISLSGTGVAPPSTLSVTITPNGSFTQGQTAEWDVQVYNLAALASDTTSGTTTLVDTLPAGYTLSSFVGTGWNCLAVTTTVTCMSTQVVPGASGAFAKLQLIVNAPGASATSVTDNVSVYGGGDPTHNSLNTAATAFSTVSVAQTAGSITAVTGTTPQSTTVNTAFANSLAVTVKDSGGNPVSGSNVVFTAPSTGPSGVFSNSTSTITVPTNASGVASAPFTANATGGGPYNVTAKAGQLSTSFELTNNFLTQSIQNFGTIPAQTVGAPLLLTATATSGLAVSYQSTTLTVCTVSSSTVTFLNAGLCSLTASQAGNSSYAAATPVTQQFTVNPNIPGISNLQAVSVGGNSEVISWTTDQPSTTQVTYGANSTPLDNSLVTYHSVTLVNLSANTTYNYDVSSTNSTNGTATSPNATFTTTPYVGYVAFWGVNNSGVTISWSTDLAANAFVAYGTTTALGQTSPVQTSLSSSHGVVLTGLNPGTTYYFRAESTDANGHTGASTVYSFTTTGQPASPAPVITNVNVTNITTTGATITWTTDQAATTQVNYGTTTSYGSNSPLNSSLLTSHSVTLTNLTPGTTYNYDVISTNQSGTSSGMSTNYTFQTTAVIATPPAISNIQTTVTGTTATITWTTDQASNSSVHYGTSSTTPDTTYVTSHSVTLTNLTPGTLYNFSVASTNAAALTTTSPNSTFTTTASNATPPYVGYVAAWGINGSNATVTWSTDVPADTQLNYGTSQALGTLSPLQSAPVNSHGVTLTGLASGTTYFFVAQSKGANRATGYSTTYSFTTTGSPSAPAPVISNIQIQTSVTTNSATITWTTDQAASSQVSYGVTTTYSASSTLDPTLTTTHSVTLTNLMPGTTYNFDVMSANINGLSSTSTNATFQTTGSAPGPVITSVAASSITSSTALITWTTDQASTSVVNDGNIQTVSSPALVTSHSLTLTSLTPNTQYSFTVTSVNASTVSTTSSPTTFTTSIQSAAPPVISYLAFWGVTNSGVTISWSTNVPSNTAVNFGISNALGTVTPVQTALTNSHGVTLTNLQPNTPYYFQAQSADVNGNTGYSTIYTFTTLAGGAPVISAVAVAPATGNTATISWTTSVPTYSYVQYGPSAGNYNRYSAQTAVTTTPSCTLGYVPSGAVHYELVSTDASGNQVIRPDATFSEP